MTAHRPETIILWVCQYYGIPLDDVFQPSRAYSLNKGRHVAMYLVRKLTDMSYPDIGRVFNRAHSTVLHACRVVENTPNLLYDAKEVEWRNLTN